MSRGRVSTFCLLLCLLPELALGAGYPPYGGTLRIAASGSNAGTDPSLADSPAEAALRALTAAPICRVDERGGLEPLLALRWEAEERQNVTVSFSSAELAQEQAKAWSAKESGAPSPYRSLLFPVRQVVVQRNQVQLSLTFPWPDLVASLCHPALALRRVRPGAGPYISLTPAGLVAQPDFAGGRPYPDKLTWHASAERTLARLFALGEADVLIGPAAEGAAVSRAPLLFATYLAFRPGAVGPDFRRAIESAVDRADLAHYFVRSPAAPLWSLLPAPLLPIEGAPAPAPAPAPLVVARPLELLLDETLPDQRAVAERIQVKLHDVGYRVSLKPLPRAILRQRWAQGDFELMLSSVLLPPEPAPALAVVLDLAGRRDLLPLEMPPLGTLDAAARVERVKARATFLAPTLSLVPLYAQGLSLTLAPAVHGLTWDGSGLPRLDGLWLAP